MLGSPTSCRRTRAGPGVSGRRWGSQGPGTPKLGPTRSMVRHAPQPNSSPIAVRYARSWVMWVRTSIIIRRWNRARKGKCTRLRRDIREKEYSIRGSQEGIAPVFQRASRNRVDSGAQFVQHHRSRTSLSMGMAMRIASGCPSIRSKIRR